MKVFITKYALTSGIDAVDAEVCADVSRDMIKVAHDPENPHRLAYYHKPDWHRTMVEAIVRAETMRLAKIASHRKSIAKLETLRFT